MGNNQYNKIKLRTNLLMTIKVLEDVIKDGGQFYLGHWVESGGCERDSMIHCGTTACIGGWLCASKEWKESGGKVYSGNVRGWKVYGGSLPFIPGFNAGEESLMAWYGVVGEDSNWRALLSGLFGLSTGPSFKYLYNNKNFSSITIQDSINAIKKLINKLDENDNENNRTK